LDLEQSWKLIKHKIILGFFYQKYDFLSKIVTFYQPWDFLTKLVIFYENCDFFQNCAFLPKV